MYNFLSRIIQFEKRVTEFLLIGIVLLVFIAAVLRSLGIPISWSVDMATLLFPWFVFLAANQALRNGSHIGVDVLTRYFPKKWQRGLEMFHYMLMGAFLIVLAIYGIKLSIENWERMINSLSVSYSFVTLSLAIGSITMLATVVGKLKECLFNHEKASEYVQDQYVS